jgi:hypothetical protein
MLLLPLHVAAPLPHLRDLHVPEQRLHCCRGLGLVGGITRLRQAEGQLPQHLKQVHLLADAARHNLQDSSNELDKVERRQAGRLKL